MKCWQHAVKNAHQLYRRVPRAFDHAPGPSRRSSSWCRRPRRLVPGFAVIFFERRSAGASSDRRRLPHHRLRLLVPHLRLLRGLNHPQLPCNLDFFIFIHSISSILNHILWAFSITCFTFFRLVNTTATFELAINSDFARSIFYSNKKISQWLSWLFTLLRDN